MTIHFDAGRMSRSLPSNRTNVYRGIAQFIIEIKESQWFHRRASSIACTETHETRPATKRGNKIRFRKVPRSSRNGSQGKENGHRGNRAKTRRLARPRTIPDSSVFNFSFRCRNDNDYITRATVLRRAETSRNRIIKRIAVPGEYLNGILRTSDVNDALRTFPADR